LSIDASRASPHGVVVPQRHSQVSEADLTPSRSPQ
jgi:hypothetical protein